MKYLFVLFTLIVSCTLTNKDNTSKTQTLYTDLSDSILYKWMSQSEYKHKMDSLINGDTLFIDTTCAIISSPSFRQLEYLQKINSEENYSSMADDNEWYKAGAWEFFESSNIKTFGTSAKYICFVREKVILDTQKYLDDAWFVISYKLGKLPVNVDYVGIDSSSLVYYK